MTIFMIPFSYWAWCLTPAIFYLWLLNALLSNDFGTPHYFMKGVQMVFRQRWDSAVWLLMSKVCALQAVQKTLIVAKKEIQKNLYSPRINLLTSLVGLFFFLRVAVDHWPYAFPLSSFVLAADAAPHISAFCLIFHSL